MDSTIAAHVPLQRSNVVYYWLSAGEDYAGIKLIDLLVRERGPEFFLHRVRTYWNRWVNKDDIPYGNLPDPLVIRGADRLGLIAEPQQQFFVECR